MSDIHACPLCSRKFLTLGCVSAHLGDKAEHCLTEPERLGLGYLPPTSYHTTVIGLRGLVQSIPGSTSNFRVGLPPGVLVGTEEANAYLLTAGQELMTLVRGLPFIWYPEIFDGEWTGYKVLGYREPQ